MADHGGDGGGVSGTWVIGVVGGDDGGSGKALGELGLGHVFSAVAGADVADFMTEDTGQLAIGGQPIQEGSGDENLAAGEGEGVDGLAVRKEVEVEFVRGLAGVGVSDDFGAYGLDSLGGGGVLFLAAVLIDHLRGGLEAEGDLLVGGHGDVLGLAGDGVLGTGREVADDGNHGDDEADDQPGVATAIASFHRYDLTTRMAEVDPGIFTSGPFQRNTRRIDGPR